MSAVSCRLSVVVVGKVVNEFVSFRVLLVDRSFALTTRSTESQQSARRTCVSFNIQRTRRLGSSRASARPVRLRRSPDDRCAERASLHGGVASCRNKKLHCTFDRCANASSVRRSSRSLRIHGGLAASRRILIGYENKWPVSLKSSV